MEENGKQRGGLLPGGLSAATSTTATSTTVAPPLPPGPAPAAAVKTKKRKAVRFAAVELHEFSVGVAQQSVPSTGGVPVGLGRHRKCALRRVDSFDLERVRGMSARGSPKRQRKANFMREGFLDRQTRRDMVTRISPRKADGGRGGAAGTDREAAPLPSAAAASASASASTSDSTSVPDAADVSRIEAETTRTIFERQQTNMETAQAEADEQARRRRAAEAARSAPALAWDEAQLERSLGCGDDGGISDLF